MLAAMLLLASGASQIADNVNRDWQRCIISTAELWATKPGRGEAVVDSAVIHCRDRLDAVMIVQTDEMKSMGLTSGQAEELASSLVGSLLRINRSFALDAVNKARNKSSK